MEDAYEKGKNMWLWTGVPTLGLLSLGIGPARAYEGAQLINLNLLWIKPRPRTQKV
jgi:hypothetical protein